MATTISTSQTYDSAARTAGDTYTVNSGAVFTIDSDTRDGKNAPASRAGSMSSFTMTSATGGNVVIDGTNVWLIAYDGRIGTPNVPALGTIIAGVTSGGTGYYTMYYTTTPGGDDFGEGAAIIVKDKDGTDITGAISGASIAFTFDYSTNTQGGYAGATDRDVTLVWGNPGSAKPGVSTGTITQSKGIAISAVAESDPSYVV